jgi:5-methylcytosine-specific restriction endonuclease McrA
MPRRLLSLLIALMIAIFPIFAEGKSSRSSSGKSSYSSRGTISRSYKSSDYRSSYRGSTHRSQKGFTYRKSTPQSGETKYNYNERYKTSGLPKVNRNESAKNQFLRSKGYKKVPQGYEVDHIVPLSKGGRDEPSNMQLIPQNIHKQKTASERKR